jgi:hypothetical protein
MSCGESNEAAAELGTGDRSGESGIPGLRGTGAGRGRTTVATYAPTESTDDFFFSRPSRIS